MENILFIENNNEVPAHFTYRRQYLKVFTAPPAGEEELNSHKYKYIFIEMILLFQVDG